MSAPRERCFQTDPHDFQRELFRNHTLTNRKNIGIVMLTRESRGLFIPAKSAAHKVHFIGDHCLAVPRPSEDNSAFAFTARDGFCRRPNEQRIVDRFLTERSEIFYLVSKRTK